jgi:hypothetical protein
MDKALARIETVPLRAVWQNEREFTRWLHDNVSHLAQAVGLEIELLEREVAIGPFAVDLSGQEVGSGRKVVIENQLEATDHSHMGQLLTYAASREAGVLIWIASGFRDEHRQVLDWLNQITPGDVRCFGVEIELLRIDGSRPAPHFKLVVFPNEERKASTTREVAVGERGSRYRDFWRGLLEKIVSSDPRATTASPDRVPAQNWYGISTGRSGFPVNFVFGSKGARVELYVDTGDREANKHAFDALTSRRSEIEGELGESLLWDRLEHKQACRIYVERPGSIEDSPETWPELIAWGTDKMLRMQRVFRRQLKGLVITTDVPAE